MMASSTESIRDRNVRGANWGWLKQTPNPRMDDNGLAHIVSEYLTYPRRMGRLWTIRVMYFTYTHPIHPFGTATSRTYPQWEAATLFVHERFEPREDRWLHSALRNKTRTARWAYMFYLHPEGWIVASERHAGARVPHTSCTMSAERVDSVDVTL